MAFPSVGTPVATTFTSLSTTHNVTMPATVGAGDTLIVAFLFFGSATTVATPNGWTLHGTLQASGSARGAVYSKIAAGNEDGTTVNFVTGATRRGAAQAYVLTGGPSATSSIQVLYATGSSANPNPPSVTATGGSADNKWIAGYFLDNNSDVETNPSNYTNLLHTDVNATSDYHIGSAHRDNATATEDPGTFTVEDSESWVAWTVLIPPPGAGGTTHEATATSSVSVTGAATGSRRATRTATTSVTVTGAATGHAVRKATGSASITITGSVTGKSQPQRTTASSSITVTAAATGKKTAKATGSATVSLTGSAAGKRTAKTTGSATVTVTTAASGEVVVPPRQATAAATITITGTAVGKRTAKATAAAQIAVTGAALGWVPKPHFTGYGLLDIADTRGFLDT